MQNQEPRAHVRGNRLLWDELPDSLKREIESRCGSPIKSASNQPGGYTPSLATRVRLHDGSRAFIKAISAQQNADGPAHMRSEARIAAALPVSTPAPRMRWSYDDGTWVAIGFDDIDGRQPQQPWDNDELQRVLEAIGDLAEIMTPAPVHAPAVAAADGTNTWLNMQSTTPHEKLIEIDPWIPAKLDLLAEIESRWERASKGTTLLHCDLRADNILLTTDDVLFVDWPHAKIGAAWIDLLLMLPSAGMQGIDPQSIVDTHSVFRGVDPADVDAAAGALAGYFVSECLRPPPPGLPTVRAFQLAQGRETLRWLRDRIT